MRKRSVGKLALVSMLALAAVIVVGRPASVSAQGYPTCNGHLPVSRVSGISVASNPNDANWGRSGGTLHTGDIYRIMPTPGQPNTVNYGGWWIFNVGTWGPAGKVDDLAPDNGWWLVPGAPKYSLVGFTLASGGADKFYVGNDSGCRAYLGPPGSADTLGLNLWFSVNDDDPWDNTGSYTVTILIY